MKQIQSESLVMRFLRRMGQDWLAWPLRRIYCPVDKDALVLEIGSGGNPYFRSNVLCDAYLETEERHFAPLVVDRPTVLAFAESLPFKDGAFDFVIASHVLEHSADPEKFLEEMQRVARAGYIETPDAFMERICSYPMHRLEVSQKDDGLIIYKKTAPAEDAKLGELFVRRASSIFPKWISKYPFHFHVRYYWKKDSGGIKHEVLNPEYRFDWSFSPADQKVFNSETLFSRVKRTMLFVIRKLFSQNGRNRKIDLVSLLRCNKCGGDDLKKDGDVIVCRGCRARFSMLDGRVINFAK